MTVGLLDILNSLATQEQALLPTFEIERAEFLVAYPTFPEPADYDPKLGGQLLFPFTCHWAGTSNWLKVGVNSALSIEDQHTHEVISCIVFGLQKDRPDLLVKRDAQWRNAYREFVLKNLNLRITLEPSGAHSVTVQMGESNPLGFDFANMQVAGMITPLTITLRQGIPIE
ncbi:MAG TPA: hypothetical protein VIY48_12000 [Candidatus Paceibacterota bacterium]